MVGLTRRGHTGGSLLKQINGVRTDVPVTKSTRRTLKLAPAEHEQSPEDLHRTINGGELCQEDGQEEDLYREPDSSDDDGESGDICPTVWKAGSSSVAVRHATDNDGFGPIRGQRIPETEKQTQVGSSPMRRSRRRANDSITSTEKVKVDVKTASSQGFEGAYGFPLSQNKKRKVTTYGSQAKRRTVTGSQGNSDSSPKATFKQPRIIPDIRDSESPDKKLKVRNLDDLDLSSPIKAPRFKNRLNLSSSPISEPEDAVFRMPEVMSDDELSSLPDSPMMKEPQHPTIEEESQSQMPIFRMPPNFDYLLQGDSTELDDGKEISMEKNEHEAANTSSDEPPRFSPDIIRKATCPMCGEVVEPDHLKTFSKGKRMNIRSQANFCRAHKRKTARDEWTQKRYPTIDWSSFDARISAHYSFIHDLLDGASCPSRDILTENVRLGKDRTLLQAMTSGTLSLSPGYYGTRGLRAMSENIMHKFSPQLRRIAVTDRLVAARGVSGYVQSVLVPELAVKLIAEDMGVRDDEARVVMGESAGMGELLNEELEDVVVWAGEEDEGEG